MEDEDDHLGEPLLYDGPTAAFAPGRGALARCCGTARATSVWLALLVATTLLLAVLLVGVAAVAYGAGSRFARDEALPLVAEVNDTVHRIDAALAQAQPVIAQVQATVAALNASVTLAVSQLEGVLGEADAWMHAVNLTRWGPLIAATANMLTECLPLLDSVCAPAAQLGGAKVL